MKHSPGMKETRSLVKLSRRKRWVSTPANIGTARSDAVSSWTVTGRSSLLSTGRAGARHGLTDAAFGLTFADTAAFDLQHPVEMVKRSCRMRGADQHPRCVALENSTDDAGI